MADGVDLPTGPSMSQKASAKKMDMNSGESFDLDYIEGRIRAYQDTVDLLQQKEMDTREGSGSEDLLDRDAPQGQMHLQDRTGRITCGLEVSRARR
jgi:predicted outer membrane protein